MFLATLQTAGLVEPLTAGGPYLLLAPIDEAFAALPEDKLDALLTNPKALADLLRGHLIEGYFPSGSLGISGQGFDRTVTNLRGGQLRITGNDSGLFINNQTLGTTGVFFVANGTRVMPVQKLFLPDAK